MFLIGPTDGGFYSYKFEKVVHFIFQDLYTLILLKLFSILNVPKHYKSIDVSYYILKLDTYCLWVYFKLSVLSCQHFVLVGPALVFIIVSFPYK